MEALNRLETLTERQHVVLLLLGQGMDNSMIVQELGCSERTVKQHISAIFARLGVASRLQAGLVAYHDRIHRDMPEGCTSAVPPSAWRKIEQDHTGPGTAPKSDARKSGTREQAVGRGTRSAAETPGGRQDQVTVLLNRSAVTAALDIGTALNLLAEGFRAAPAAQAPLRVRCDLPGPGTATCLMPGLLPGVPAYTVKVNAKFPAATPALRGVVCLHSLDSGELLALADSASVTAWRTGLAAALATHILADPAATTLGFVGAGAQARIALAGLYHLRGRLRVVATDPREERAAALADVVVASAAEVAAESDVVVLATWSREPLLDLSQVRPGQQLIMLGADEPGKVELSRDLLVASRVIVDDVGLVTASGALASAGLGPEAAAGTLSEVLRGEITADLPAGRPSVYAPIGLPWQDLALTWPLYQHALSSGTSLQADLLA
jgi:ornithine cyclodeaminase/alanine dehydrogenase-like protein (mu-crystallin family)/DNA-binding CsgD family transcriptional regulator